MKRICKNCGREFEAARKDKVFCNNKCVKQFNCKLKNPVKTKVCLFCNKNFETTRKDKKYCNSVCKRNDRISGPYNISTRECLFCGKEITSGPANKKYCSDECKDNGRRKLFNEPKKNCVVCGGEIDKPHVMRLYCSDKCRHVAFGNKEETKEKRRKWREENREKCREYNRNYRERNHEEVNKRSRDIKAKRVKNDPCYRLKVNLRVRLYCAIKNGQKAGSAIKDLGCTVEELKVYIESKFYNHPESGEMMTWDNWGKGYGKWQLDHISELQFFNLDDREEFLEACNYRNLQPLWYEDHIEKGIECNKKGDHKTSLELDK